jgi:hypothetical protein
MRRCKSPFVLEHDFRANAMRLSRGKTGRLRLAIQVRGSFPDHVQPAIASLSLPHFAANRFCADRGDMPVFPGFPSFDRVPYRWRRRRDYGIFRDVRIVPGAA